MRLGGWEVENIHTHTHTHPDNEKRGGGEKRRKKRKENVKSIPKSHPKRFPRGSFSELDIQQEKGFLYYAEMPGVQ
jgi:hypothetical protein